MRWGLAAASLTLAGCLDVPGAGDNSQDPAGTTGGSTSTTAGMATEPTGESTTTETSTASTTESTTTTSTVPTSGSGTETDGVPCVGDLGDNDCRADAPYCVAGVCTACADLAMPCADLDATQPVCDDATGACTGCTEHEQCASGACRIATGACFGMPNRLFVDNAADCASATGSEQAPFCTIEEAIDTVDDQPGTDPWAVFVAGSATAYTPAGPLYLPDRSFALIGAAQGVATQIESAVSPVLGNFQVADHYVAHVVSTLTAGSTNLSCSTAQLWLDGVELRDGNTGLFVGTNCQVNARNCRLTAIGDRAVVVASSGVLQMQDSEIDDNLGAMRTAGTVTLERVQISDSYVEGGILVDGGVTTLSNVMFANNIYFIGDIDVAGEGTANLNYVTAAGDGISCSSPDATLNIRNSILAGVGGCEDGQVSVTHSLVSPPDVALGANNVALPTADYGTTFVGGSDYHIGNNPPAYILGVPQRTDTDPAVDFDGDPRPAIGQPDYPGADAAP